MSSGKENIEVRLTGGQIEGLKSVAKMAGVNKETVIKVLLALYVLKHPAAKDLA